MSNENNLENWWEEGDNPVISFGAGDGSEISVVPSTAWGDVGTVGGTTLIPESEMEDALDYAYLNLQKTQQADEWFHVIRRCSEHYVVREFLIASEEILYDSPTSTKIKNHTALPENEIYFHILRAFARAEEDGFKSAQILWDDIHANWLSCLNDYRKPHVLVLLYLTSICSGNIEQSSRYLQQLWSIIKFMDGTKRHAFGIWDEWTTCLLVTWIFMKYSSDFCRSFCSTQPGCSYPFTFQKKSIILQNLDVSLIADAIEYPYYVLARECYTSLPKVQYKGKKVARLQL